MDKIIQERLENEQKRIEEEENQGYGIPYKYDGPGYEDPTYMPSDFIIDGYELDSNERVLNNMIAMAYAYDLTWDKEYINGVVTGMDYLLGIRCSI